MMTYMKNYIRILTMITALMFGAANGAWAQAILNDNDIEIRNRLIEWMRKNRRVILKSDIDDPDFYLTKEELRKINELAV